MHYRQDIQILRGIAVLLVVMFHLEIGGVQSGFLGVDVFFVISGFLMGVLYDSNDIFGFFTRRAKRLLPAYFVTIFVTMLISLLITTPVDFDSVGQQSLFAVVFSSNIGFWLDNSYFSKAEFKPLLHLWSLGVEIQYYVLVPFLFLLLRNRRWAIFVLGGFSLICCFILVTISPKTSFFMVPFRLWEFILGYSAAILFTNQGSLKYKVTSNKYGVVALFTVISIPLMLVEGNSLSILNGHPGLISLLVTLATFTVLVLGLPKSIEESFIGKSLEVLGRYSYSIYLVHFPVIVLFLYQPFNGTVLSTDSWIDRSILISVIIILSLVMYHLIETSKFISKNLKFIYLLPCFIILTVFGGNIYQGLAYPKKELLIFDAWTDRDTYRCGKVIRVLEPTSLSCQLNETDSTNGVILVGNSHADSIKLAFNEVAKTSNINLWFLVENTPLMPGGMNAQTLILEAQKRKVNQIVLHYSPGAIDIETITALVSLAEESEMIVSFIMPVPVWPQHIPEALYNSYKNDQVLPKQTLDEYWERNLSLSTGVAGLESHTFEVFDVSPFFCKPTCSIVDSDGRPLYFDESHLTLTGSRFLNEVFYQVLDDKKTTSN